MKKTFTKIMLLLFAMVVGIGNARADVVTFSASTDITANAQSYQTDVLTINADDGSTWKATGYGATANTNIVIGKGGANYLETPSVNGNIISVAVTWSGNTKYYLSLQTTSGTVIEDKSNPSTSSTKTFTISSGSYSQLRLVGRRSSSDNGNAAATITSVVVTYTPSGGGSTPSIIASNVNIASDKTSGKIEYSISNGTGLVGASITNNGGGWLTSLGTITASEVPFNCTANETNEERTATVTLTYSGATDKVVTITQAKPTYDGQGTFTLITSTNDLEDGGYYVLVNSGYAMNSSISSGKMGGTSVSVNDKNEITNPSTAIVWYLEKTVTDNTIYCNLYNEYIGKYCYIQGNSSTSFSTGNAATQSFIVTYNSGFYFQSDDNNGRYIAYYSSNHDFRTYTTGSALSLYKLAEPSDEPAINVADASVAATATNSKMAITYENMTISSTSDFTIKFCDSDGNNTTTTLPSWITSASITKENDKYYVACSFSANQDEENKAYIIVSVEEGDDEVISNVATLTQQAPATTYTLAESIISGKHYLIVATSNTFTRAMGGKNSTKDYYDAIDAAEYINNSTISVPANSDIQEFVIIGPTIDGYYTIYDPVAEGYLYASSSSSNDLSYQTTNNANGLWEIDLENNTVTAKGSNTHNLLRYNSSQPRFSCYTSGQNAISFYAKDNESTISPTLDIAGCATAGTKAGYYLIAPPVGQVTPTADNNFLDNSYDLYRFNQSGVNGEWENWKAEGPHNHFNLVSGRGYLYANSSDVTLTFEGYQYVGNGQVFLSNDENATFAGWNLIGNPWNQLATVGCAYYKMNNQGTDLEAAMADDPVAAMQGIFVHASTTGDNVTFTKPAKGSAKSAESHIALNIIDKNNNVIDRAIVCFDEGGTLPKFMLDESNTKIYIPSEDDNYAIVRSEGNGTMPVNFKARQMGKYTISVNTEGINMDYLHLIDRLTGEDVNLLLDNSYSFIASAQDVESRFILSFTASGYNQDADEPFAFQNGSDIIVNGTGELQIFDLVGRMVSTQNVNGIETIDVKSQGVYIFRLNEKTQKIVVR